MAKKWFRWLKMIVLVYAIIGILLYWLQDFFIFHPKALAANHVFKFSIPFKEATIPLDSSTSIHLVQFEIEKNDSCKGVVLYFHGNKENVERFAQFVPLYTKHGYQVWIVDYPTYGKSTGPLTEPILHETALQLYKLANSKFTANSIIIYGKSLGSGIAAQLAATVPCKQLILETPYYSLKSLASFFAPIYPSSICKYNLNTYSHLPNIVAPITIFHGTNDWIIPYNHTKKLMPLLQPKDVFYTIEGASHNYIFNIAKAKQALDSTLSQ
jgi:uncharacterized protein